jgi:hypothetical protein
VYQSLNIRYSYFNMAHDSESFPRCNNALKHIDVKYIKKASQWCILNRKHTKLILGSDNYFQWFNDTVGDEHCYITYMHYIGQRDELIVTNNASDSATTFTNWPNIKYMYQTPNVPKIKIKRNQGIKNYTSISTEEIKYLFDSKCLFGRKFDAKCDLGSLDKLLDYEQKKLK